MRKLSILCSYIRRFILQWMAGRSFVLTLVLNQAVTPLIGLAVWSTALPDQQRVASYYVVMLAVQLLTVSYEHHTFANRIYNGELIDDLLRPHPVVLHPLGENLALRIWHLVIGLPLILAAGLLVSLRLAWGDVALALPALLLAATLRFLFTYLLACSAFWTARAHGIVGFGETLIFLLGGVAAPISLLPDSWRSLGEALPFRAMQAFPAELAVGSLSREQITIGYGWQLVWLLVFMVAALAIWRAGIRRYTAVGG